MVCLWLQLQMFYGQYQLVTAVVIGSTGEEAQRAGTHTGNEQV